MSETSLTQDLIEVLDMVRGYGSRATASGLTRLQLLELALVAERVAATHAAELEGLRSVALAYPATPTTDGQVEEDEAVELRA